MGKGSNQSAGGKKRSTSKKLKEREAELSVTREILELGQRPVPLNAFLSMALEKIFQVPRLALEPKGSIFLLSEDDPSTLNRTAGTGLSSSVDERCRTIEMGWCLCGMAAMEKRIVFKDTVDPDHVFQPEGMEDHGHYCVPIMHRDALLGVINLYVKAGYRRIKDADETFLLACAHALASVIERKRTKELLRSRELLDPITRTFHRLSFLETLEDTLKASQWTDTWAVLLFVELMGLKKVNQSLGENAGDLLLMEMADRIRTCAPPESIVARTGGSRFAVLLKDLPDYRKSMVSGVRLGDALLETSASPVTVKGTKVDVQACIGASLFPKNGQSESDCLQAADVALRMAKRSSKTTGENQLAFYSSDMDAEVRAKAEKEKALRHALQLDKLRLHFQPKINLATGRITGFESLIRWPRENGDGMIPPLEFIPLAEETGLILPLGEWIMRRSCGWIRDLRKETGLELDVSVNVSAKQFLYPRFDEMVSGILREVDLNPGVLDIEITETHVMEDMEDAIRVLHQLRSHGISISLDDFGTGFSSLGHLRNLPLDRIKMDRSFVRELAQRKEAQAIAKAVIQMGHSINMKVIAEGVEKPDQLEPLRRFGCDSVQGFLLSRPLAPEHVPAILKEFHHPGGLDRRC